MSRPESAYHRAVEGITSAVSSQMFGKLCYKINGKAFVCFFQDCMVFKLSGEIHKQTLLLKGAVLFDPSAKGRAMKDWVQVPYVYEKQWKSLAEHAAHLMPN